MEENGGILENRQDAFFGSIIEYSKLSPEEKKSEINTQKLENIVKGLDKAEIQIKNYLDVMEGRGVRI